MFFKFQYPLIILSLIIWVDPAFSQETQDSQKETAAIEGKLVEKGSRKAIKNHPVMLMESGAETVTDEEGAFVFENLEPGKHTIYVPKSIFKEFSFDVVLDSGEREKVTLRIERLGVGELYQTEIKEEKEKTTVSEQKMEVTEISNIPGLYNDALKAVQMMPGVARSPFSGGELIIRGSSPEDSKIWFMGLPMYQLFHFGGLYSIINTDLLESVKYYPGVYPAYFGNAIGGVVNVEFSKEIPEIFSGYIDSSFIHTEALLKIPLSENHGLTVAARRSYIDVLLPIFIPEDSDFSFSLAPRYYDYQVKYDGKSGAKHSFQLMVFGTDDRLESIIKKPEHEDPYLSGKLKTAFYLHKIIGSWTYKPSDELKFKTSGEIGMDVIKFSLGKDLKIDQKIYPVFFREDVEWKASKYFTLNAGGDVGMFPFSVFARGPLPPKEGEEMVHFSSQQIREVSLEDYQYHTALYAEAVISPAARLKLIPALRTDIFYKYWDEIVFDPRFMVRYEVADGTTLKAGAGIFHQMPMEDEVSEEFGTPGLSAETAYQLSGGFEHKFSDKVFLDVQGFYKWMEDLVVKNQDYNAKEPYTNEGEGRVYGMELILRHEPSDYFFGWLSYTLQRAERKDHPGDSVRPFDFDQTHILTLLGSVKLPYGFRFGLRFRYISGNPYTPVEGSVYDADNDLFVPIYSKDNNSKRFPSFHQLDLRLDRTFLFDSWKLTVYIDVQNVYMNENPEFMRYNYDYSESDYITGLPIIPSLGIKGEF